MGNLPSPASSQAENPYSAPSFAEEFVDVEVFDTAMDEQEKLVNSLRDRIGVLERENLYLLKYKEALIGIGARLETPEEPEPDLAAAKENLALVRKTHPLPVSGCHMESADID